MESGRAGQSASLEKCKGCAGDFFQGQMRYYTGQPEPFSGGPYHVTCLPMPKAVRETTCPHCGKEI